MLVIVGCGTLGSRVVHQLQEHELTVIDHDVVYKHNLATQQYTARDVGTQKVYALMRRLPNLRTHNVFLDQTNIDLLKEAEAVIDCTDNLLTRELLDKYCYDNGIPLIHAAAAKKRGIVGLFVAPYCLRSVYHNKISLDNCRGSEIDKQLADRLANEQTRLAKRVLAADEQASLALAYPDRLETIKITPNKQRCQETLNQEDFYITWCPQAQCLSAKPLRKKELTPREETIGAVHARVHANGEIHFSGTEEIDALKQVATTIYNN
jgi:molybdopterin/thiamine biosynthesis adenylyltransferase